MKDRLRAILLTSSLLLLGLLVPPVGILSAAAISLIALRRGLGDALTIMIACLILVWMFGSYAASVGNLVAVSGLLLWLPTILIAVLLRWSQRPAWSIEAALGLAILVLLSQYMLLDNPVDFWGKALNTWISDLVNRGMLDINAFDPTVLVDNLAHVLPQLLALGIFLQLVITLLLSRWWQSLLYYPGGFREEFVQLRLKRTLAIMCISLLLLVPFVGDLPGAVGQLMLAAFALQGLAVAHVVLNQMGAGGWLVGVYVLLFVAGVYMMALLGVVGLADSWLNFRQRLQRK